MRPVDVIVGRAPWQRDVLDRAEPFEIDATPVPVVRGSDLILLKLYARGHQDAWDIEQLLAGADDAALVEEVEARLAALPAESRRLWRRIREGV